jgi:sulfur-oxidizing protein SoxY
MHVTRRALLKAGGSLTFLVAAAGLGLLRAGRARAAATWNQNAFTGKSVDEVVQALGGTSVSNSTDIVLTIPEIAENGAVVPVVVESRIANTRSIMVLVEKNPNALSAIFEIPEGTDPYVSARIKLGATSNVYAMVKTDHDYFITHKEVKVTLGGCGG